MQARAVHNRYYDQGISAFSLHPGIVPTNLQSADPTVFGSFIRHMVHWHIMPGSVTPTDGTRTTLFCATSSDAVKNSGQFFLPFGKLDPRAAKWIDDETAVSKLWDESGKMLKEHGY